MAADALPNAEVFILKNGGHMFFNNEVWQMLIDQIHGHIKKWHNKANSADANKRAADKRRYGL